MLPKLPATIDIIFKTAEIILIIIVTIHAHPLPFHKPHATTNSANPRAINVAPSIPINPPTANNALFGMVTTVPLTLSEIEVFEVLIPSFNLI